MKAEFLYKHLIVAKIANWCYVKTLCSSKSYAFVCSLHKKVSMLMFVNYCIHKQCSANKSPVNSFQGCCQISKFQKSGGNFMT